MDLFRIKYRTVEQFKNTFDTFLSKGNRTSGEFVRIEYCEVQIIWESTCRTIFKNHVQISQHCSRSLDSDEIVWISAPNSHFE